MKSNPEMQRLLSLAIQAAIQAGRAVLEVYGTDFAVEQKADDSPLTLADRRSHRILHQGLEKTGFPILSEEGRERPYEERRTWRVFWLLDPLDGTKEFVKRNGEFTINIALISEGRPILGVIYVPVADLLYFGMETAGAYKLTAAAAMSTPLKGGPGCGDDLSGNLATSAERLPSVETSPPPITVVGSRSHGTAEIEAIVHTLEKRYGEVVRIAAGSSLKICMVAEGRAHLYPRTGPTMEWDTAAGQAIAEAAGARMVAMDTGQPLRYNKEDLRNPWFVVQKEHYWPCTRADRSTTD